MVDFEYITPNRAPLLQYPMQYTETAYESTPGGKDGEIPLEPFCLADAPSGSTGIVYGVILEQGMPDENPTVHIPIQFTDYQFGDIIDLGWEGNVYLKWLFDADGVGEVNMVGPEEPDDLVPYSPDSDPPEGKSYGYYMLIGSVDSDGFHQEWTGNVIVQGFPKTVTTHSWKITPTIINPGDPVKVNVRGGKYASQGCYGNSQLVVEDVANKEVSDGYFVYLKVIRDSSTREVTGISYLSIIVSDTELFSAEDIQYIELGTVGVAAGVVSYIHQTQFEDINVFEDMYVKNGEFELVPLVMSGKQPYPVPSP